MRAEKVFVPLPLFVRRGGQVHCEQNPLVAGQSGELFQPSQLGLEFFYPRTEATVLILFVEDESRLRIPASLPIPVMAAGRGPHSTIYAPGSRFQKPGIEREWPGLAGIYFLCARMLRVEEVV